MTSLRLQVESYLRQEFPRRKDVREIANTKIPPGRTFGEMQLDWPIPEKKVFDKLKQIEVEFFELFRSIEFTEETIYSSTEHLQRLLIKRSVELYGDAVFHPTHRVISDFLNSCLDLRAKSPRSILRMFCPQRIKGTANKKKPRNKSTQISGSVHDLIGELEAKYGLAYLSFCKKIPSEYLPGFIQMIGASLQRLVEVTGLDASLIGFGKKLSVRLAPYKNEGLETACFVPGLFQIQMFIGSSPETFVHEWAHALDYFLGQPYSESDYFSHSEDSLSMLFGTSGLSSLKRRLLTFILIQKTTLLDNLLRRKCGKGDVGYFCSDIEIFARSFEVYSDFVMKKIDPSSSRSDRYGHWYYPSEKLISHFEMDFKNILNLCESLIMESNHNDYAFNDNKRVL